jgi:hypothetical protein
MSILLFRIAAALCFLAVALGAFGAHSLKQTLETHGMLDVWNKAVLYHFVHALALLVVALCRHSHFQWQFVCDGADKFSLARSDYAHRRSLFSCRLGVAGDRAAFVGEIERQSWNALS